MGLAAREGGCETGRDTGREMGRLQSISANTHDHEANLTVSVGDGERDVRSAKDNFGALGRGRRLLFTLPVGRRKKKQTSPI
jgi:hypothetical protein